MGPRKIMATRVAWWDFACGILWARFREWTQLDPAMHLGAAVTELAR